MVDITSTESLLAIANIVLIIVAIFLFYRFKKTGAMRDQEKEMQTEPSGQTDLTGIADIKPEEFKPARFEINPLDVIPRERTKEKTETIPIDTGKKSIQVQEKNDFKLEDDLTDEKPIRTSIKVETEMEEPEPIKEEKVPTPRKRGRKKKAATPEVTEEKPEIAGEIIKEGTPKKKPGRKKKTDKKLF